MIQLLLDQNGLLCMHRLQDASERHAALYKASVYIERVQVPSTADFHHQCKDQRSGQHSCCNWDSGRPCVLLSQLLICETPPHALDSTEHRFVGEHLRV